MFRTLGSEIVPPLPLPVGRFSFLSAFPFIIPFPFMWPFAAARTRKRGSRDKSRWASTFPVTPTGCSGLGYGWKRCGPVFGVEPGWWLPSAVGNCACSGATTGCPRTGLPPVVITGVTLDMLLFCSAWNNIFESWKHLKQEATAKPHTKAFYKGFWVGSLILWWAYNSNKRNVSERQDKTYLRNKLKLTYHYI